MNREELIVYDKWLTRRKWGTGEIISPEKAADSYLAEHPLPPAEGAEAFVKSKGLNLDYVKGIQLFLNPKYTVIDLMTEFAAQQQPTAEGAEEILTKHLGSLMPLKYGVKYNKTIDAMREFATLHAQRIAEKMASERLREELIAYDKFLSNTYWGVSHLVKRDEAVDEYLKSREK